MLSELSNAKSGGFAGVIGYRRITPDGGREEDTSAAIVAAANTEWPPQTIGLRILDREGREVFAREKARRR